ncbi:MAG: hypothetical protein ABSF26_31175, partial [Thermoguttaceae bacterium]
MGGASASDAGTPAAMTVADAPLYVWCGSIPAPTGDDTYSEPVGWFVDGGGPESLAEYSATITWNLEDGSSPRTQGATVACDPSVSDQFTVTPAGPIPLPDADQYIVTVTHGGASYSSGGWVGWPPYSSSGRHLLLTEGSQFSGVVGSFSGTPFPGLDPSRYDATIFWGDCLSSAGVAQPDGSGGFTVSGDHTYKEAGYYAIRVVFGCSSYVAGEPWGTAAVGDAALTPQGVSDPTATEGAAVPWDTVVAAFSDGNPASETVAALPVGDFVAQITWAPGQVSTGSVQETGPGQFQVSGGYGYGYNNYGYGYTYFGVEGPQPISVMIQDIGGSTCTA